LVPSALALPLSQSPPENGKWGLTPLFPPGPRGRPRLPHEGRRLHERPHRDLDRLETREGTDGTRAAAAPVRVLPVLRQLRQALGSPTFAALKVGRWNGSLGTSPPANLLERRAFALFEPGAEAPGYARAAWHVPR